LVPRAAPLKEHFPLLVADPSLHYLDSAATSQKPRAVLDAIRDFYETSNANPHRGAYALSARATERYQEARETVAHAWGRANVHAGDEIVVTALEHHANFVPWQQLALAAGARLRICEPTAEGRLDLDHLRALVGARTRVVAFNHVSNALGTVNPVSEVVRLVRAASDAVIVCDGAQAVPHLPVAFDRLGVDFYAFSGHKMCGPMGIGGLVGRRALLEAMPPYQMGGDMIEVVDDDRTTWNLLPHKFEAGTPNVADAVGLAAAVRFLDGVGMGRVLAHERELTASASRLLADVEGVTLYGPPAAERSGVVSFSLAGVHPHDLSTVLDERGVCIRAGTHCAQPLMRRLGVVATARASFYLYNDADDVAALVDGVLRARALFAEGGA
jgi:cysteine desulfurase/selenocysteine lyase